MTLIVLGAGATRGAEFAENNVCKPPLNSDYFTQLQRISNNKHFNLIKSAIKDAVSIFGKNFNVTMEEFFTQIEFYLKVLSVTKEGWGLTRPEIQNIKRNFIGSISAVFEESITNNKCKYHSNIISSLQKNDTIISFNYDCLIDYALLYFGAGKWNPKYGYCFPLKSYKQKGFENWLPTSKPPASKEETIKLLKLHGSLNWQIDEKGKHITLKQRLHQNVGIPKFTIIPPEWNKETLKDQTFIRIWREAAARIHKERIFVFIGFSFVPTDLYAASLFQMSVKAKGIEKLIIVNPDREARKRTRALLNKGISESTLIIQFDSIKEFSKADISVLFSKEMGVGKVNIPYGAKKQEIDQIALDNLKKDTIDQQNVNMNKNEDK